MALGVFGVKAWANVYLTPPAANAMPVQVQAGQFAFYFRYPGPDGTFGALHPEMINEANQISTASIRPMMPMQRMTSSPPRWPSP